MRISFRSTLFFLAGLLIWALPVWGAQTLSSAGWHLVHTGGTNTETLLNIDNIHSIWKYDNDSQAWKVKFKSNPAGNPFGTFSTMNAGEGYWIRTTANSVEIPSSTDGIKSVDANTGWHLLGTGAETGASGAVSALPTFDANDTNSGGTLWVWNSSNYEWQLYVNGASSLPSIYSNIPGISSTLLTTLPADTGFWANMGGTTTVTPPIIGGQVASYPTSSSGVGTSTSVSRLYRTGTSSQTSFGQDDMTPTKALVSVYELIDSDFGHPIATVKTDNEGSYSIKAEDVKSDFLTYKQQTSLIPGGSTPTEAEATAIETYIKSLGKLQVRAVVIKGEGENKKALSFTSIADPTSTETVKVNPIVSRLVKSILDTISQALETLRPILGSNTDSLITTVLSVVETTITTVLETADTSTIEIPEGQEADAYFESQEASYEMDFSDNSSGLDALEAELVSTETEIGEGVDTAVAVKDTDNEDADATASLDSEESGMLTNLETQINEQIAEEASTNETYSNNTELQASNAKELKKSFQEFFLSLGYAVILNQTADGATDKAVVLGMTVDAPSQVTSSQMPGKSAFGNRTARYFKIGTATIDGDFSDAPSLADELEAKLLTELTASNTTTAEATIETLLGKESDGSITAAEQTLLDRVRMYHKFVERMENTPVVSDEVIERIIANKDKEYKISAVTTVVANNYKWINERVNVTTEGFPIFTGRFVSPSDGESVDNSELNRALQFTLGDSPAESAEVLTETLSFAAQFAPDVIEERIQRSTTPDFTEIYPSDYLTYKTLIIGDSSNNIPTSPSYQIARDKVARGLTSALSNSLYGKTLTSETTVNIKTAFFLINYLLDSTFAVDSTEGLGNGYFENIMVGDGTQVERAAPFFDNLKELTESGGSVTVASILGDLLNSSTVENSDAFSVAKESFEDPGQNLLASLPPMPEFEEIAIDNITLTGSTSASLVCYVERFDGLDPRDPFGDTSGTDGTEDDIEMTIFGVEYDAEADEFFKGDKLIVFADVEVVDTAEGEPVRIKYTFNNIPALSNDVRGVDYVLRFGIAQYQNDLPEIPFFVDGFAESIEICPPPAYVIGSDNEDVAIPGMGLVADQQREYTDRDPEDEAMDLSNYEVPGGLTILSESEVSEGKGKADFRLTKVGTTYQLTTVGSNDAGFAPIYGKVEQSGSSFAFAFSLSDSFGDHLEGLEPIVGANVRSLITSVSSGNSTLSTTIDLDPEDFNPNRVYFFRDLDNNYWAIELRFIESFDVPGGLSNAFIDFGFVKVNSRGEVEIPVNGSAGGVIDEDSQFNTSHVNLSFGDTFVLENPTSYSGPNLIPPQAFEFSDLSAHRTALEEATDGIFFSYAGEFFDEEIAAKIDGDNLDSILEDFDARTIPVRVEATRSGISFVKLSFRNQTRDYVLSPAPSDAGDSITGIEDGDIIAILESGEPKYFAQAIRDKAEDDPEANFEIGFEIVQFSPGSELSDKDLICFSDDHTCPSGLPNLFVGSDLDTSKGIVFDRDFDGVAAIFDPNDQDANIPGTDTGGGDAGGGDSTEFEMFTVAETSGDSVDFGFVAGVRVYPGEVREVSLKNATVFGDDAYHVLFECEAAKKVGGVVTDVNCSEGDVQGVDSEFLSDDGVAFKLAVTNNTFNNLGERARFDYKVKFRKPVDLEGNVFQCGNSDCPKRSDATGRVDLVLPEQGEVSGFSTVKVQVGNDTPVDFFALAQENNSLDVGNELTFRGNAVANAQNYELSIFCAGVDNGDIYLEGFQDNMFASSFDSQGNATPPEFNLGPRIPGGRTCDFVMSASIENDAGEFIGMSRALFEDIRTTGGFSGDVDNDFRMVADNVACFDQHVSVSDSNSCDSGSALFTLTSFDAANNIAVITLDSSVKSAKFGEHSQPVTEGSLDLEAAVGTVVFEADSLSDLSCGVIMGEEHTNSCAAPDPGNRVLDNGTDVLEIAENNTLALTTSLQNGDVYYLTDGDNNEVSDISLDNPGFFFLWNKSEPDAHVKVAEISVEIYDSPNPNNPNETIKEGYLRVQQAQKITAFYDSEDSSTSNVLNVGIGFLSLDLTSGQPIDFDIRSFNQTRGVKFEWFLQAAHQGLAGTHDFDGDGNADVTAEKAGDPEAWSFVFGDSVTGVQFEDGALFTDLERNASNVFEKTGVDPSLGQIRFDVSIGDRRFGFDARDLGTTEGSIEIFEHYDTGGQGGSLFDGQLERPTDPTTSNEYLVFETDIFNVVSSETEPANSVFTIDWDNQQVNLLDGWSITIGDQTETNIDLSVLGSFQRLKSSNDGPEFDIQLGASIYKDPDTQVEILDGVFVQILPPGDTAPGGEDQGFERIITEDSTVSIYYNMVEPMGFTEDITDNPVFTMVVSANRVVVTSVEGIEFQGDGVFQTPGSQIYVITQLRELEREIFYNMNSVNPGIPSMELVIYADDEEVKFRIQNQPSFFDVNLNTGDSVYFEEQTGDDNNTFFVPQIQFAGQETDLDTDLSDGSHSVMWYTKVDDGGTEVAAVKLYNGWTLTQERESDPPTDPPTFETETKADSTTPLTHDPDRQTFFKLVRGDRIFFADIVFHDDGSLFVSLNPADDGNQDGGSESILELSQDAIDDNRTEYGSFTTELIGSNMDFRIKIEEFDPFVEDQITSAVVHAIDIVDGEHVPGDALVTLVKSRPDEGDPVFTGGTFANPTVIAEGSVSLTPNEIAQLQSAGDENGAMLVIFSDSYPNTSKFLLSGFLGNTGGQEPVQNTIFGGGKIYRTPEQQFIVVRADQTPSTGDAYVALMTVRDQSQTDYILTFQGDFAVRTYDSESPITSVTLGQDPVGYRLFEGSNYIGDISMWQDGEGIGFEVGFPGGDNFKETFNADERLVLTPGGYQKADITNTTDELILEVRASGIGTGTDWYLGLGDGNYLSEVFLFDMEADTVYKLYKLESGTYTYFADVVFNPTITGGTGSDPVEIEILPPVTDPDPDTGGGNDLIAMTQVEVNGTPVNDAANGKFQVGLKSNEDHSGWDLEYTIEVTGIANGDIGQVHIHTVKELGSIEADGKFKDVFIFDEWEVDQETLYIEGSIPLTNAEVDTLRESDHAFYLQAHELGTGNNDHGAGILRGDLFFPDRADQMPLLAVKDNAGSPLTNAAGNAIISLFENPDGTTDARYALEVYGLEQGESVVAAHIHTVNALTDPAIDAGGVVLPLVTTADEWETHNGRSMTKGILKNIDAATVTALDTTTNRFYVLVHNSTDAGILRANMPYADGALDGTVELVFNTAGGSFDFSETVGSGQESVLALNTGVLELASTGWKFQRLEDGPMFDSIDGTQGNSGLWYLLQEDSTITGQYNHVANLVIDLETSTAAATARATAEAIIDADIIVFEPDYAVKDDSVFSVSLTDSSTASVGQAMIVMLDGGDMRIDVALTSLEFSDVTGMGLYSAPENGTVLTTFDLTGMTGSTAQVFGTFPNEADNVWLVLNTSSGNIVGLVWGQGGGGVGAQIPFTDSMVEGETFYNVFKEGNQWYRATIIFNTTGGVSEYEGFGPPPVDLEINSYSINNGILHFIEMDGNDTEHNYLKITDSEDHYLEVYWGDSEEEVQNATDGMEYFFTNADYANGFYMDPDGWEPDTSGDTSEFSEDLIEGNTYYDVHEDNGTWNRRTIIFDATGGMKYFTGFNPPPTNLQTHNYSIDSNGILSFEDSQSVMHYLKIVGSDDYRFQVFWGTTQSEAAAATSGMDNFFFNSRYADNFYSDPDGWEPGDSNPTWDDIISDNGSGATLYNVFEDGGWQINPMVFDLTNTQVTIHENIDLTDTGSTSAYSIDTLGILSFAEEGTTYYVKISHVPEEGHVVVNWVDDIALLDSANPPHEHLFDTQSAAETFKAAREAEDAAVLEAGRVLFNAAGDGTSCATCHGTDGTHSGGIGTDLVSGTMSSTGLAVVTAKVEGMWDTSVYGNHATAFANTPATDQAALIAFVCSLGTNRCQ